MKIAILSFYSGHINRGVETWAKELQRHSKKFADVNIISGVPIYFFWKLMDSKIIVSTGGRFEIFFTRIWTWIFGKRLVVFSHSGPGADDKWNLWCLPNIFIAFSRSQAAWAHKFKLHWTKILVIPHAVDTTFFVTNKDIKKSTDILCVAAKNPDKRVDLVSKAVKLIPDAKLMVIGSGQEIEVSFEKMPQVYQRSKVFCFVPQHWEAFGLVFLEAMACNLPVVTIDDPVRREIVGEAGIFVKNPENIEELASAISLALTTDWKNKPRQQALKFSWDKIALEYENLFNKIV